MGSTALARSLVNETQIANRDIIVEPRVVNAGGIPISMGARVQSVAERMRSRGQISERQFQAAERIHRAYCLGLLGVRDSESGGSSAHDPGGIRDRQLDEATLYRRIREAVGLRLWKIVFAVAVESITVDRFANERGGGMDRKQWMGCLKVALDTAADYLGY